LTFSNNGNYSYPAIAISLMAPTAHVIRCGSIIWSEIAIPAASQSLRRNAADVDGRVDSCWRPFKGASKQAGKQATSIIPFPR
jgi:hypothetical protein